MDEPRGARASGAARLAPPGGGTGVQAPQGARVRRAFLRSEAVPPESWAGILQRPRPSWRSQGPMGKIRSGNASFPPRPARPAALTIVAAGTIIPH